ncbi:hypothetical protein GWK47_000506 [Chionoecetes opilio]|uniref:Transmembrane protein n=1 Tax=Chionoecetes opilio TaxID=41210 RepID=A0A8J4YN92_CHIOP|nr:hypothetical protein GWK47_000506 [Chionoecetes opilio]
MKARRASASAEPEQSPPPVMFSQQKGMMLQSRCPRRPPHPSTRRSRPAKGSDIINPSSSVGLPPGQATDFFRCGPFFFPNVFFSAAAFFLSSSFSLFSPFNLRSDIASSFSVKMQARTLFRPFQRDED